MKKIKLLWVLFIIFTLTKCAKTPFENNPPFIISKAFLQSLNNETNIVINYTSKKNIEFKELFFRDKKRKIVLENNSEEIKTLSIQLKKVRKENFDIQLHGNSKQEFGNKPHQKESPFHFNLKNNEAVLSYKESNTIKYFKIKNIKKEE